MSAMDVADVDPRDAKWELDAPSYRVHFHDASGSSDEHELTDADVAEVLAWAEANSASRSFVLYVCVPVGGLGLIRLAGTDPNGH